MASSDFDSAKKEDAFAIRRLIRLYRPGRNSPKMKSLIGFLVSKRWH